jgi:hypothetical protein
MTLDEQFCLVFLIGVGVTAFAVATWQTRKYRHKIYPPVNYDVIVHMTGRSITAIQLACEESLRRSRQRRGLPLEGSGEPSRMDVIGSGETMI